LNTSPIQKLNNDEKKWLCHIGIVIVEYYFLQLSNRKNVASHVIPGKQKSQGYFNQRFVKIQVLIHLIQMPKIAHYEKKM
jgi:hypothetical protein